MDISKISTGKNPPSDVNVIIEVPMETPIKYEFDKDSGAIIVDRFFATPMRYPCNYGFIPNTLSDDGDPADALVVGQFAIAPGAVIRCRPVGVLYTEDEKGGDEKLICVPHSKVTQFYDNIAKLHDLPQNLLDQIQHFFEHYKDLEQGKWVKVTGFGDVSEAEKIISDSLNRAQQ